VYYPRSFLKFILLGFLLVSLPLIYALAELTLSLDRLASQASTEVLQAAQAGRESRLLFEQSTTLERIARQHLILEDNALLDDYLPVRQDFRQTAQQLAALPLEPAQVQALNDVIERESRLYQRLHLSSLMVWHAKKTSDAPRVPWTRAVRDRARILHGERNAREDRPARRADFDRERWSAMADDRDIRDGARRVGPGPAAVDVDRDGGRRGVRELDRVGRREGRDGHAAEHGGREGDDEQRGDEAAGLPNWPRAKAWYERISGRDAFRATTPVL